MKGLVVNTDGQVTEVELVRDIDGSTLRSMRAAIGVDLVDCVELAPDLDMWVDDEGLFNGSPVNIWATAIRQLSYPGTPFPYPLTGNALFTGGADRRGATLPISDDRIAHVRTLVEDVNRRYLKLVEDLLR